MMIEGPMGQCECGGQCEWGGGATVINSMDIMDVIRQAYETFGFISNDAIERMRNVARLEVGQNIISTSKRTVLRSCLEHSKFTRKEMETLYKWFEEGHRQAVFWGKKANFLMVTTSYARLEPTIDQQRFVMLFKCLSPWGLGDHSNLMAKRLFKLTDTENVKQMNFSVFSKAFFVMTKATLQERLKLLFSLHCSKLTTRVSSPQPGAMATRSSVTSLPSSDLDTDEESSVEPPNPAREASEAVDHSTPTTAVEKENESHDGEDDSALLFTGVVRRDQPQSPLDTTFSPPPLTEADYVELCKTMFLLVDGCPDQQHLFHVMGLVANTMLKQGEVNRELARAARGQSCAEAVVSQGVNGGSELLSSGACVSTSLAVPGTGSHESTSPPLNTSPSVGLTPLITSPGIDLTPLNTSLGVSLTPLNTSLDGVTPLNTSLGVGPTPLNTSLGVDLISPSIQSLGAGLGTGGSDGGLPADPGMDSDVSKPALELHTVCEAVTHIEPNTTAVLTNDMAVNETIGKVETEHRDDQVEWFLTYEQFAFVIQQEPEMCQFFAEQSKLVFEGRRVDMNLDPYTRAVMASEV
eukprot:Em0006g1402a